MKQERAGARRAVTPRRADRTEQTGRRAAPRQQRSSPMTEAALSRLVTLEVTPSPHRRTRDPSTPNSDQAAAVTRPAPRRPPPTGRRGFFIHSRPRSFARFDSRPPRCRPRARPSPAVPANFNGKPTPPSVPPTAAHSARACPPLPGSSRANHKSSSAARSPHAPAKHRKLARHHPL